MVDSIISSVQEAPWLYKLDTPPGQPREWGQRFLGDKDAGPWVYLNSLEPDRVVPPHVYSMDEVMYVIEGQMTVGERVCGPGTILYNKAFHEYGFTVGPEGVLFLNVRNGLANYAEADGVKDPWAGAKPGDAS